MINQFALNIIKDALWGKETQLQIEDPIYQEFKQQAIHTFIILNCKNLQFSDISQIKHEAIFHNSRFIQLLDAQQRLASLLGQIDVIPIILKGSAAAQYYDVPNSRCIGDIDFVLYPFSDQAINNACVLLTENGYVLVEDSSRHISFYKGGFGYEMHKHVSYKPSNMQYVLDKLVYASLPEKRIINKYCFYCLPDIINGLIIINHIGQHLADEGIGLRQIIDWLYFVKKHLNSNQKFELFKEKAIEIGIYDIAKIITRMCVLYLDLPNQYWCDDVDTKTCEDLWAYVLKTGNFGRKQDFISSRIIGVLNNFPSINELQRIGEERIKEQNANVKLIRCAWIYQLWYFLRMGFRRKKPIKSFFQDYYEHKKRQRLFKKLDI